MLAQQDSVVLALPKSNRTAMLRIRIAAMEVMRRLILGMVLSMGLRLTTLSSQSWDRVVSI